MASDAQNRATANYRRKSVRQLVVRFYPKDAELFEHVKSCGGSAYLKELIRRDLETRR